MICRSCGGRAVLNDRHCVYCGKRLRLLPTWTKLLALPLVAVVVTVSAVLVNRDSATLATSVYMRWAESENQRTIVVGSQWLSSKAAPTIDGVLDPGEWGPSVFTKNAQLYRIHGKYGTADYAEEIISGGEVGMSLSNDNASLYVAVALTTAGLEPSFLDKEHVIFLVYLIFDSSNNGELGLGEDVRKVHWDPRKYGNSGYYSDFHWSTRMPWGLADEHQDGEAAACFIGEENPYFWEFRIPLSSGDPEDLAVVAGDTIGVQLHLWEWGLRGGTQSVVWPGLDWAAPNTFANIVLAAGPG
jgi:hypothetical protein